MQVTGPRIVVLGTGGTIAGRAASAHDNVGYEAAQLGVDDLLEGMPGLASITVTGEQVAQIDSKDMDFRVWCALAQRCADWLADDDVRGIVVTHGTDTMEETAFFLQALLAPSKPVVLTGAMRPASSRLADGPRNLADAIAVAAAAGPGRAGVVVAFAGQLHSARDVRKVHSARPEAFASGDAGPLATIDGGRLVEHETWPAVDAAGLDLLPAPEAPWPWVEIVTSDAGADGRAVRALLAAGIDGIVVAATGTGSVHRELAAALEEAAAARIPVLRATRCLAGGVAEKAGARFASAGELTPVKARIELLLQLLAARRTGGGNAG